MRIKQNFINIFIFLSIFLTISILYTLLALNTFLKADDFCLGNIVSLQNHLYSLWHFYLNLDGRAASPVFLFRNLIVNYLPPEANAIFSTLSLIGIAFFIVASVNKLFNQIDKSVIERSLITLLVSACLWLGIRANLSRVIYWPTGNYYIYTALFLFGALYYLICSSNRKKFIVLGVLAIFAGINLAFSFSIIYLLYIIIYRNKNFKDEFNILVFFLIAFLIMFLAPGNFARASRLESGYDFNLLNIIKNYFIVFVEYLMMSKWILITSVLSAFLFNISKEDESDKNNKLFKLSLLMFLGALLTIAPFVVLPQAATRHTSIYFQLLLFFGILMFALWIRSKYILQKI
jgi:hypothetical protein